MLPIVAVVIFLHVDFLLGEVSSRHSPITLLGSFARTLLKLWVSLKAERTQAWLLWVSTVTSGSLHEWPPSESQLGTGTPQKPCPLPPRTGVVGCCVKWCFHYRFIFETLDKTGLVWFD